MVFEVVVRRRRHAAPGSNWRGAKMRVFTPAEVARRATNKYLGVLIAAKYARLLNEFPRMGSDTREKKLTTRALEELTGEEGIRYHIVPRRDR
jgi:DNA-directed RNA polymerase subunit K/omega